MLSNIQDKLQKFEKLGTETQTNGTKLIGKATHIAPKAWLHTIYKGLSEPELTQLETELSFVIPSSYRDFLTQSNGLHIFNTSFYLDGLRISYDREAEPNNRLPFSLADVNLHERPSNAQQNDFFIGGYDWDGSKLFMRGNNPMIFRCDRYDVTILNSWNDLEHLITSEIDRLLNMHNEFGVELDEEQPLTP